MEVASRLIIFRDVLLLTPFAKSDFAAAKPGLQPSLELADDRVRQLLGAK